MKARSFTVLIVSALVATIGSILVITSVTNESKASAYATPTVTVPHPEPLRRQDPDGIIDGAQTPEKIPDRVAYTLLFRFLSNRQTDVEKNRARSYLRMVFGCDICPDTSISKEQRAASQANVEKLLALAQEFESQIQALDIEARNTRQGRLIVDLEVRTKLQRLQSKKEQLITKLMASLRERLGSEGYKALDAFVTQQFKRRVKLHDVNSEKPVAAPGANLVRVDTRT